MEYNKFQKISDYKDTLVLFKKKGIWDCDYI